MSPMMGFKSNNLGESEVAEDVEVEGERSPSYSEIRVRETCLKELTRNQ